MRSAYIRNDDGWGLMRMGRRGPVIHRGMPTTFDDFWKIYTKFYEQFECAVHFRFATQGARDLANCHPYDLGNGVFLMHNGVIPGLKTTNPTMSDTWHFGELIKPYAAAALQTPDSFNTLLSKAIGGANKLVIMDKNGFQIVNAFMGTFDDGIWYSNTTMWSCPLHLNTYGGYYGWEGSGCGSYSSADLPGYERYKPKVTTPAITSTYPEALLKGGEITVPYESYKKVDDEKNEYKTWWENTIREIGARCEAGDISAEMATDMIAATNGDLLEAMEGQDGIYRLYEPKPMLPLTLAGWSMRTSAELKKLAHAYPEETAEAFNKVLVNQMMAEHDKDKEETALSK